MGRTARSSILLQLLLITSTLNWTESHPPPPEDAKSQIEKPAQNATISDEELQIKIAEFDVWMSKQMNRKDKDEKPQADDPSPINLGSFSQFFELGRSKSSQKAACDAATVFVGYLFLRVRANASPQELLGTTVFICKLAAASKATTSDVCQGMMERMTPTFVFIVKERPNLTPKAFVGTVLQQIGCETDDPSLEWDVELSKKKKRKPRIWPNNTLIRQEEPAQFTKIIHFADLHIDPLYEVGAKADCANNILCCHPADGRPTNESDGAGFFADDRKCDPPWETLDITLAHMAEKHPDTRVMYFTGDIVPHNIWYTSQRDNSFIIRKASQMIKQHFPNTMIIPMLGNHEPHPVNFFSPKGVPNELDTNWVYDVSYESWKDWIPPDQKDNYLKAGFYSVDVDPTLKIIAINTNVCYGFNFWQLYEVKDPGGQLTWMVDELYKAEASNQNVHVVGHVPPGHPDCSKVWSRNFYKILNRFKATIKGQWYGHTHYDELKVFYDPDKPGEPIGNLWIGGSFTPYRVHNMAYKIFYADGSRGQESTWDIYDHETWIFDLKKANDNPDIPPEWYRLYSAKEAYGIPNVLPKSLGQFVDKLATNQETFDLFYQHYFKANTVEKREECDTYCRKLILCGIVQPYHGEGEECDSVQKKVDMIVLPGVEPEMPPIKNNNTNNS